MQPRPHELDQLVAHLRDVRAGGMHDDVRRGPREHGLQVGVHGDAQRLAEAGRLSQVNADLAGVDVHAAGDLQEGPGRGNACDVAADGAQPVMDHTDLVAHGLPSLHPDLTSLAAVAAPAAHLPTPDARRR